MFRFNWRLIPFVGVVCLVALAASASDDALDVRVEPHKSVVFVGEPVLITAVVTNSGSEPVEVIHHNAPSLYGTLSVVDLLLGANEEHLKRWDDLLRPAIRTEPRLVPPGGSITVDLVMLFNSKDGFFATEPGRYWIRGRIFANGEVLGPSVAIEVRAPSPSDQATWEWLNAHKEEYGRLVQIPWEAKLSEEFLQESARLCDTSPSAYVEYLALFLSRSYREGPKKDAAQAARFADIAKARASSEKIRAEAEKLVSKGEPKSPP
jgi:hypothetical protein